MASLMDGEDRVVATAQHILKSLGPTTDLANDMLSILSTFDHRLSSIAATAASPLDSIEDTILHCEDANSSDHLPWEDSPSSAADYLSAVDVLLDLSLSPPPSADPETVDRADTLLQTAMSRLEDELRDILLRNAVPLDADHLYRRIPSATGAMADGDDRRDSGSSASDPEADLLRSDAVDCLRDIADRMVRACYEKECCQAYVGVRRDALNECLSTVGIERLSIEEVQKIEWKDLDEKMKKWSQAIKIAVRFLFPGERHLCDQIFGSDSQIAVICFAETAKYSVMKLLNFGEAVSIGRPTSERLFRILDMYEALSGAIVDLETLFSSADLGEFVCREARAILAALGEAVKSTFAEFESAIKREPSNRAMQGGEIHPLTRYVMNFIKLLVDYSNSLNSLLDDGQDGQDVNLDGISPIGQRLVMVISYLESNLKEKSKLYEDVGLQYVFLMNNMLYIVQKIKDSELRPLFGDQWVRKHRVQIRQYATSYLRASWTGVLSCMRDDGLGSSGSLKSASKMMIKERFKKFNLCFEEIYRNQTGWKVSDPQLREELQLSVSEKVIPAYRSFVGRFGSQLESGRNAGKYVKYSPEDMENLLLDLFEGSPGSLNHPRRKHSM